MKFTPHEMSVLVFIAQRPDFLSHYISSLGVEARQVAEFLAGRPPASSTVEAVGLGIRAAAPQHREKTDRGELQGAHLLMLFELVCGMDLYDSSRLESFHPALRAVCEALIDAGLGDRATDSHGMTVTTARKYLAYLDEVAAEIARERAGLQPPTPMLVFPPARGVEPCDGGGCGHPCSVCGASFGDRCGDGLLPPMGAGRCPDGKRECVCKVPA